MNLAATSTSTNLLHIHRAMERREYFLEHDGPRADSIEKALDAWMKANAPRGSGIDCGTELRLHETKYDGTKIVFTLEFHKMDEHGSYCGWQSYVVIVKSTFSGVRMTIRGKDYNGLKDHLHQVYEHWLSQETKHAAIIEHEFL